MPTGGRPTEERPTAIAAVAVERERPSARWPRLPGAPRLARDEVHVVRAGLNRSRGELERFRGFLRPRELQRVGRFRRAGDARRALASRGILRVLLGRYLGLAPGDVELIATSGGKPLLRDAAVGPDVLHFNVSHCRGFGLYAFTRIGSIGVDVEGVRDSGDLEALADRFFSRREAGELSDLDPSVRPLAFFHCWTRKEALLKATGEGLFRELSSFDVTLRPGEPARLVAWRGGTERPEDWSLHHLAPARQHVGAFAVRGAVGRIRGWTWWARPPNRSRDPAE